MTVSKLSVDTLTCGYEIRDIVHDVSFNAVQGEITLMVGRNGSGKSTLLRGILGLLSNCRGSVNWAAKPLDPDPWKLRSQGVVFIPQRHPVFLEQTVQSNMTLAGAMLNSEERNRRIDNALDRFSALSDRIGLSADRLSGGERQQLALACAMVSGPELLLVDEPTAGLSPIVAEEIFAYLQELAREGSCIILVEHDVKNALNVANRVLGLHMGRCIVDCSANDFDEKKQREVFIS